MLWWFGCLGGTVVRASGSIPGRDVIKSFSSTQPSILPGLVNRVLALLARVKVGCDRLCSVPSNFVWSHVVTPRSFEMVFPWRTYLAFVISVVLFRHVPLASPGVQCCCVLCVVVWRSSWSRPGAWQFQNGARSRAVVFCTVACTLLCT